MRTEVRLAGTPPFALVYVDGDGRKVWVDLQTFRPDPSLVMRDRATYAAEVKFKRVPCVPFRLDEDEPDATFCSLTVNRVDEIELEGGPTFRKGY